MKEKFLNLVDMHQGIIHRILSVYTYNEEDRKDLMQEILLQLWKGYPSFSGRAAFSTWMYKVALNTALLYRRIEKKQVKTINIPVERFTGETNPEQKERLMSLYMAINQLAPVDKAIALLYLEQKKYEEIEEIMGISKNNVGIRINRIKKKLKKIFEYEQKT